MRTSASIENHVKTVAFRTGVGCIGHVIVLDIGGGHVAGRDCRRRLVLHGNIRHDLLRAIIIIVS